MVLALNSPFAGSSGLLTWVRHSSCESRAAHSCQRVQYFRLSKQRCICKCLGFLTCAQTLMHAIAHGGCTDTVRESALEVDCVRKIFCCTGDLNLHQYCAWLLSLAFYQVSYPALHVRNIRACFSHRGKMGMDKSSQVVIQKHWKAVLHLVVWAVEPLATVFTAQHVSQLDTCYCCLLFALILLLLVKLAFCWFHLHVHSLCWAVCCAHRLLLPEKSAMSLLKSGE